MVLSIDRPALRQEFGTLGIWEEIDLEFFAQTGQRQAAISISLEGGKGSITFDNVRIEQQVYLPPAGLTCLTGNSPRLDVNLSKKDLEKVKYTYRVPGTDKEQFPTRKQDRGPSTGWVSAVIGKLTNSDRTRPFVQWSLPGPDSKADPFPKGHEILFDLGRDYAVQSIEVRPTGLIEDVSISIKPDGAKEFHLKQRLRDSKETPPSRPIQYVQLNQINSSGRYVRIIYKGPGHGLYFVRIWGKRID